MPILYCFVFYDQFWPFCKETNGLILVKLKFFSDFMLMISHNIFQQYLLQFGYLDEIPVSRSGASDPEFSEAVKDFQRYAGLPETGN